MSPEIITGKPYGVEVDMWSCGVILYILLGGYPPFYADDSVRESTHQHLTLLWRQSIFCQAKLFSDICHARYSFDPRWWDPVSDDAKDLIKKLMTVDPSITSCVWLIITPLTAVPACRQAHYCSPSHAPPVVPALFI